MMTPRQAQETRLVDSNIRTTGCEISTKKKDGLWNILEIVALRNHSGGALRNHSGAVLFSYAADIGDAQFWLWNCGPFYMAFV